MSSYQKSFYAEFCKSSGAQDHCLKEVVFFWTDVLGVREYYNFVPIISSPHVIVNTKMNTRFIILTWKNDGSWQVVAGDNDSANGAEQRFDNISHHSMISNPLTLRWMSELLMLNEVQNETTERSRMLLEKFLAEDARSANWLEHHYRKVSK